MTARDDAVRAAVAPLLDELRGELVVLPREPIVEQHLDMMAFERQVLDAPRPVRTRQPRRADDLSLEREHLSGAQCGGRRCPIPGRRHRAAA